MPPYFVLLATLGQLPADPPKLGPAAGPAVFSCQLEGRTMILTVLPDGSKVRNGDLVCELDASRLRDRLVDQRIALLQAERELRDARHQRAAADEVAEKAKKRSSRGRQMDVGEVALARSDLLRGEDQLKWLKVQGESLKAMGVRSFERRVQDEEAAVDKARIHLEVLESKAEVQQKLLQLGPPKLKEESTAIAARYQEKLKEDEYMLIQAIAKKLERQILQSTIRAPFDGTLRLANRKPGRPGPPLIEDGAIVHERQKLLTIEPG